MNDLVDTSTWRYAVICVRTEPARERLVIAYPDEETLRDLIAAPSIVALGYTSPTDALKNIDRGVITTASLKRLLKTAVLHTNLTFLTECRVALRRLAGAFRLSGTSKIMRNLLHNGLAAVLIFFYSRNVLSSTVRASYLFLVLRDIFTHRFRENSPDPIELPHVSGLLEQSGWHLHSHP